jgi:hypothetical protein
MIEQIIITSLVIFGIHNSFKAEMILNVIYTKSMKIIVKYLPSNLWNPIEKVMFTCPPCMASLYGTVAFILFCLPFYLFIPFIFAVSGLNYILNKI